MQKTRFDRYELAFACLNGGESEVCKAAKEIYASFLIIWNSTNQTYREKHVEKNIKIYIVFKAKIKSSEKLKDASGIKIRLLGSMLLKVVV